MCIHKKRLESHSQAKKNEKNEGKKRKNNKNCEFRQEDYIYQIVGTNKMMILKINK